MSGNLEDTIALKVYFSAERGLLSDGGASQGNLISRDTMERLFTVRVVVRRNYENGKT
jgi:hypothetical protein